MTDTGGTGGWGDDPASAGWSSAGSAPPPPPPPSPGQGWTTPPPPTRPMDPIGGPTETAGAPPPGGPPPGARGEPPLGGEPTKGAPWLPIAAVVVAVLAAAVGLALALTGGGDDDGDAVSSGDPVATTEPDDADDGDGHEADTTTTSPETSAPSSPGEPHTYGDDPVLDALWDGCEAGGFDACDQLFFDSAAGSEYEAYGDSCGERNEPAGLCTTIYGEGGGVAGGSYGDDPAFDALWDDCEAGDPAACDDLYRDSPVGSEYEAFGDTCGNRNEPSGWCEDIYG